MRHPDESLISVEWSWWKIGVILVIIIGIIFGIGYFLLRTYWYTPQAASDNIIPSPTSIALASFTPLTTPSLRLVTQKQTVGYQEKVPVDLYLNTGGVPIIEVDIVITYDTDAFKITEQDVTHIDVFKVIGIEEVEKGKLKFSLFSDPEVGQSPVTSESDIKIATLTFYSLALDKSNTLIDIVMKRDKTEGSQLIALTQARTPTTQNVLKAAEGVVFTIGK